MPGTSTAPNWKVFIRDAASTYWHQSGTAKMGRDAMSVVDAQLKVYGIDEPSRCRWLDHAADHDGQHHGAVRDHRRARGGCDQIRSSNLIGLGDNESQIWR